jgi:hypothetical protein
MVVVRFGLMVDCSVAMMVVLRVGLMVGYSADCWAGRMVLTRVELRAD